MCDGECVDGGLFVSESFVRIDASGTKRLSGNTNAIRDEVAIVYDVEFTDDGGFWWGLSSG